MRKQMDRRLYYYPLIIIIFAVLLGLFGWFTESSSIRWVALAFGLALMAVGVSLISLLIALRTEKRATELGDVLSRIEIMAEEMKKELNERANSGPPIIASLQGMAQNYMDYIKKQKEADDK